MTATAKLTVAAGLLAAFASAQDAFPSPAPKPTVPTIWPTYSPTKQTPTYNPTIQTPWPTYSPTTTADGLLRTSSLRCPPSFDSFVEIDDAASMQYSIVSSDNPLENAIFCGRLFVEGHHGWVSIAFSEDGNMPGSDAIVANIEERSIQKYHLGGKSTTAVTLMEDAKQTLQDTFVGEFGNMTIVEFTKLLVEENEVAINADGVNIFLHARGHDWPGYHSSRMKFVGVVEKKREVLVCNEETPCPDGEYCKLEPGKCLNASDTHEGTCARIIDNCNWPVSYKPVCGCDGETYGNECEVDKTGTSVAYAGKCEDATRLVDLSKTTCLENQCLDPDGICGDMVSCFADPCEVQNECSYAECEANYCGGCNHICRINETKNISNVVCIALYDPVCGEDGVTYSNDCEAGKVNATIAYKGECTDTAQTSSTLSIFNPEETCSPGGTCSTEGSTCSDGTETCCGQTYASLQCDCFGGFWSCLATEACMLPSCCQTGPPQDLPPPSMDFCVSGQACDTGIEDDYCCYDYFGGTGYTYCTQSGGGGVPVEGMITTSTATATATNNPVTIATSTTLPAQTTESPFDIGSPTPPQSTLPSSMPTTAPTSSPTALPSEATQMQTTQATQTSTATEPSETSTTTEQPIETSTVTEPIETATTSTLVTTSSTSAAEIMDTTTEPSENTTSATTTTTDATDSSTTTSTSSTVASIEGRPGSTAGKSARLSFSSSVACLLLVAWNL